MPNSLWSARTKWGIIVKKGRAGFMNDPRSTLSGRPAWVVFSELEPAAPARTVHRSQRPKFGQQGRRDRSRRREQADTIRSTAMSFRNMHQHGDLLVRYLEARRAIFVDRLRWNVSEADGLEFDQYDTPFCRWVVLHEFGEVIGGVRLIPTTARSGIYTYMLRDAQNGILADIPTDVLFFKAPVDPNVWEASRFFITDAVPAARRTTVQRLLFDRMTETAQANGASSILGIVPGIWSRWARRLGRDASPIGARFAIDGSWNQAVLFHIGNTAHSRR
jgi:N-acyl-L-homoserine lactone synthetase